MPRSFRFVAVLVPVVFGAGACSVLPGRSSAAPGPPGSAVVERPVDGDTVIVRIGDTKESVRFIGIDTPESVAPERPVECFGVEAKHRMAELLPAGTHVVLERDVEARDKYGRLLAYVRRADDGLFVNLRMVEEGMAESFPFPPNTAHQADFDRAEATAKATGQGLWPACGSTDVPVGPPPG